MANQLYTFSASSVANQVYTNGFGVDAVAQGSIEILSLGGFVDPTTPWTSNKTFTVFNTSTGTVIATLTISLSDISQGLVTTSGQAILKNLPTPVTVAAGTPLSICSMGYGNDKFYNGSTVNSSYTADLGGGLISLTGYGRTGSDQVSMPTTINPVGFAQVPYDGPTLTFQATIVSTSLTPGTLGVASSSPSGIVLNIAGINGGTAPYSTQLYGSTSSGFTPGSGNTIGSPVTGATPSFTVGSTSADVVYFFKAITTDAASNKATTGQVAASKQGASCVVGLIGDSLLDYHQGNSESLSYWTDAAIQRALQQVGGVREVAIVNEAHSGTDTGDWFEYGYLTQAIAAFTAAGVQVVMLQLGTNDVRTPANSYPAGERPLGSANDSTTAGPNGSYAKNFATILAQLKAAGFKVYVPGVPYFYPTSTFSNVTWNDASLNLAITYNNFIAGLVDNVSVFGPVTSTFEYFANNPGEFFHEANTPTNGVHPNQQGVDSHGVIHAAGLARALGMTAAAGTFPAPVDVRAGVTYGASDGQVGTLEVPMASQVLAGVQVDATTGTIVLPTAAQVASGVAFGPGGGTTGTLAGGATLAQIGSLLSSGVVTLAPGALSSLPSLSQISGLFSTQTVNVAPGSLANLPTLAQISGLFSTQAVTLAPGTLSGMPTLSQIGGLLSSGTVTLAPGALASLPTLSQIGGLLSSGTVTLAPGTLSGMPTLSQIGGLLGSGIVTLAPGALASLPTLSQIGGLLGSGIVTLAPNGIDAVNVESGVNTRQALSLILAASAGIVSGAGTGVVSIKGGNVAATRIVATTDNVGNRSSITLSVPN